MHIKDLKETDVKLMDPKLVQLITSKMTAPEIAALPSHVREKLNATS